jgi:hypothetical protein
MKRGRLALLACALGACGCAAGGNGTVPTTMVSKSGKARCVFDGAPFCTANRRVEAVDTTGLTLDRRNLEERSAAGAPALYYPMRFPDGGTFEVTCSVTRDGRVVYAQVVPGAPLSDNDIESLDASGYCSNKSAN